MENFQRSLLKQFLRRKIQFPSEKNRGCEFRREVNPSESRRNTSPKFLPTIFPFRDSLYLQLHLEISMLEFKITRYSLFLDSRYHRKSASICDYLADMDLHNKKVIGTPEAKLSLIVAQAVRNEMAS